MDQLTCEQLHATYACADYCADLCLRAPACGPFDTEVCAKGCARQSHSVCNAKSVVYRSCDTLEPELRLYEEVGRAGPGEVVVDGGSASDFGLCRSALDCAAPLGCSVEISICTACTSDADCDDGVSRSVCSGTNECVRVDCTGDAVCPEFCNLATHVCGECHEDTDCPSSSTPACNTKTNQCVRCVRDEECSQFGSVCDATSNRCVQCLSAEQCSFWTSPRCDPDLQRCTACEVDSDCKRFTERPLCVLNACAECAVNADCKDPEKDTCDKIAHECLHVSK